MDPIYLLESTGAMDIPSIVHMDIPKTRPRRRSNSSSQLPHHFMGTDHMDTGKNQGYPLEAAESQVGDTRA
jgi:hypothetical protein